MFYSNSGTHTGEKNQTQTHTHVRTSAPGNTCSFQGMLGCDYTEGAASYWEFYHKTLSPFVYCSQVQSSLRKMADGAMVWCLLYPEDWTSGTAVSAQLNSQFKQERDFRDVWENVYRPKSTYSRCTYVWEKPSFGSHHIICTLFSSFYWNEHISLPKIRTVSSALYFLT